MPLQREMWLNRPEAREQVRYAPQVAKATHAPRRCRVLVATEQARARYCALGSFRRLKRANEYLGVESFVARLSPMRRRISTPYLQLTAWRRGRRY